MEISSLLCIAELEVGPPSWLKRLDDDSAMVLTDSPLPLSPDVC